MCTAVSGGRWPADAASRMAVLHAPTIRSIMSIDGDVSLKAPVLPSRSKLQTERATSRMSFLSISSSSSLSSDSRSKYPGGYPDDDPNDRTHSQMQSTANRSIPDDTAAIDPRDDDRIISGS